MNKRLVAGVIFCGAILLGFRHFATGNDKPPAPEQNRERDTDGDGLADELEISIGTDPTRADSDDDAFSDSEEIAWNTSPVDSDKYPTVYESVTGWWRLDEGEGARIADIADRAQTGVIIGDAISAWKNDLDSSVFESDGTRRVEVPQPDAVVGHDGLTILVLARLIQGEGGILMGRWNENDQRGYALAVENRHLVFHLYVDGIHRPLRAPMPIADEEWHVVAASYDGFEIAIYLDGERVARSHTGGSLNLRDETLVIGQAPGSFADAVVLGRALGRDEIRLLSRSTPNQVDGPGISPLSGSSVGRLRLARGGAPPGRPVASMPIIASSLDKAGGR